MNKKCIFFINQRGRCNELVNFIKIVSDEEL